MARKKWSAEEKQKIVLAGLRNEASIAELCKRHGVSMEKNRRLLDEYQFPGFRPMSKIQGILGDHLKKILLFFSENYIYNV